jgi:MFS family permease
LAEDEFVDTVLARIPPTPPTIYGASSSTKPASASTRLLTLKREPIAVILSFIISFGVVKALANLFAGRMSDRLGRKGILIAGWLIGLPAPFLVMFAPTEVFSHRPLSCIL